MNYPEHEKLKLVKDKSQSIHEFIHWLNNKGILLAVRADIEGEEVMAQITNTDLEGEECAVYFPHNRNLTTMVAEFFDLDEYKLECEKLDMLDQIRKANE